MGNCSGNQEVLTEPPRRKYSFRQGSFVLFENFSRLSDYKKKYEFVSTIGSGGFGKVRLFRDKRNPEMKYAIKTMKKAFRDKHSEVSLIREVHILRKLDHPNIVKYYETYEDEVYISIVMEYIPGDNLVKMIALKSYNDFSEKDILCIITVLLRTLKFLHSNGLVHRDVKPDNILFSIAGNYDSLKLIDFGLTIGKKDKDFYQVGSPHYMAPEQIEGHFCFESDIWSVGVLLYFMVTGKHPFNSNKRNDLYYKIKRGKYNESLLRNCSPELKDLIRKILVVDHKKRLNVTECLNHPWIKQNLNMMKNDKFEPEILESIKEFNNKNALQKEILFMMATVCQEKEIMSLKQAFNLIDSSNSGEIEYSEIPGIFERVGITPTTEEIESVWKSLDFHKDGKINYSEFLAASLNSIQFSVEEKLWSVFRYFDMEDNGYITADSVINALKERNLNINENGLKELFSKFEGEKKLNFEQFKEVFYSRKKPLTKKSTKKTLK